MKTDEKMMVAAVEAFYRKMEKWESSIPGLDQANLDEEISDEEFERKFLDGYLEVFAEFCSRSAEPRGYNWTEGGEYIPSKLKILRTNINGEEGEAIVRGVLPDEEVVFQMVVEDNKWKIKRRYKIGYEGAEVEKSILS